MKILVANVGSSSFKYKLYETDTGETLSRGYLERIGMQDGIVTHQAHGKVIIDKEVLPLPDYEHAVKLALSLLTDEERGAVGSLAELACVVFKPVAVRGLDVSAAVEMNEAVLQKMDESIPLAPRHNPPYITVVRLFNKVAPGLLCMGLFEPGFHSTIPEHARIYGIPYEWTEKYGIRGYGYHGASHGYIAQKLPQVLGRDSEDLRIINCHLGGSSSICAIKDGKSVDTSMGFSPQSGLLQSTRCGDTDIFIWPILKKEAGLSDDELVDALSAKAGMLGISGLSGDMRELWAAVDQGNARARLAIDAYIYGIKKTIGAYAAVMGGLDALNFTGGIGERDARTRKLVCEGMEFLGIRLDVQENNEAAAFISRPTSAVAITVIPADEEWMLAQAALNYLKNRR